MQAMMPDPLAELIELLALPVQFVSAGHALRAFVIDSNGDTLLAIYRDSSGECDQVAAYLTASLNSLQNLSD